MFGRAMLEVALPIFAVAAVGWLLGGWRRFDFKGITELLLYVCIPALLVDSLISHEPRPSELGLVGLAALGVMLGTALVAWSAAALLEMPRRGVIMPSVFMNAGNFGLPLALLAWGEPGLAVAVLYYLVASLVHNTVGIWIACGGSRGWREIFRLPLPYAAALGLVLAWSNVQLPPALAVPVQMLGQAAIPLMLLSLGYALRQVQLTAVGGAFLVSLMRMGVGGAIGFGMVRLLDIEGLMAKSVVLASALPSAVMNVVLAQRYDAAPRLVASAILVSTLLSIIAVPLLLVWLG